MSKVEFEAVQDPHIRLAKKFAVDVRDGPAQISYYRNESAAPTSFNQVFTITPAPNQGLSRYACLRIRATSTITMSGNITAANFAVALRAWPVMGCLDNTTVSINGVSVVTSNMRQIRKAWARVSNPAESQSGIQSTSSTAFDNLSRYGDQQVTTPASIFAGNSVRGDGVYPSRTTNIVSIDFANAVATVVWDVTEPLVASPFVAAADNQTALYGLSGNVTIQMTLSAAGLQNALSIFAQDTGIAGAITLTSVATVVNAMELQYQLYTPTDSAIERLPAQWYHMPAFDLRTSAPTAIVIAGDGTSASTVFNTNSYILNQVPRLLLIWVESQNALGGANSAIQADFAVPIQGLQIDFLNKQGILVGTSQQQLYQHSVTNGLRASYSEFAGLPFFNGTCTALAAGRDPDLVGYGAGTCVVIDCASLDLPADIVPGTNVPCNIRVTATTAPSLNARGASAAFTANSAATQAAAPMTCVLQVLAVSPAFLQLHANAAMYVQGGLTPADAANARKAPATRAAAFEAAAYNGTLAGGSFFSDFAKGFSKVADFALPLAAKVVGLGSGMQMGGAMLTQKGAMTLRERLARQ